MRALLESLGIRHEIDVPLGPLTWYGVGGPAKALAHPADVEQLSALARACHEHAIPLRVLGAGANLLVSDAGVAGVVVRLDEPAFTSMRIDDDRVIAGGGYDLFKLVPETARVGLAGLECLAGVPATVGGAVRMNAGGAYGDIGRCVLSVRLMDARGEVFERSREGLIFGYRRTNIVAPFILEVTFQLTRDDPDTLVKRFKEIFLAKKASQPFAEHSAGCAFKNPQGDHAGRLIDRAGLKGFRIGGAEISTRHANFIAAVEPSCTAGDILAVMDHVQRTIRDRFGVELEREVVVWR